MIIQRYLLKEIVVNWIAVTAVLFLIYISNRFIRYLADAAAGSLPADVVLILLALKSLTSLPILLPLALYLAVLLALGRFYKDSEMTALAACGVGLSGVLRAVAGLSLVVTLAMLALSLYAAPWAQQKARQVEAQAQASADFSGIASGRFKESRSGDFVFYTERISADRKVMENVFAHQERDGITNLLAADKAYQTIDKESGDRFVVFADGYRYEGVPGDADFKIVQYKEHGVRIQRRQATTTSTRLAARPTEALWRSTNRDEIAELHWRFAMPLSTLFLTILAVMLSRTDPRQGRFAKLFSAILVYLIYNNLMGVGRSWLEQGVVPAGFGLWWVHGLLFVLFSVLWVKQLGLRWTARRLTGFRA